jgi:uncharacterized membrane protein YkvA (DUF1232 family)
MILYQAGRFRRLQFGNLHQRSQARVGFQQATSGSAKMMEELTRDAVGKSLSLHSFQERQEKVCRDFWATLRRFAGQVPFVEDLVAAYYCVMDPATPMRVRGILLAALAFRARTRPLAWLQKIPGLGSFTDDAAVLAPVFGLSSHITPLHRAAAAKALGKELPKNSNPPD